MATDKPHVLVVEDEPEIARLLKDYLEHEGFQVTVHHDGGGVVESVKNDPPDFLMLDLMLPTEDGISICRRVRQFSDLPIMMLTARVDEIDRLLGLELGADDYVCKPFLPREVVARVRSILRRTKLSSTSIANDNLLTYQEVTLNLNSYRCSVNNHEVSLTKVEFHLLQTLMQHPGRVYSRDALMNACYSDNRIVSDRTIDSHIRNLRRKISEHTDNITSVDDQAEESSVEQSESDDLIQSIYGVGYRLG